MPCLHETNRTDYGMIGRSVTDWDLQGQLPNFVIEPFPTKKGKKAAVHCRRPLPCRARTAEARASRGGKGVEGREEGGEERRGRKGQRARRRGGEQEQDAKSHLRSPGWRSGRRTRRRARMMEG